VTRLSLENAVEQIRRLPTNAMEARVLLRSGLVPLARPQDSLNALLMTRRWGPVAGAIRIAAHRDPDKIGLVDERGELTFLQLDERSNALARAWRRDGLDDTSVIAVLCRDHRGLIETMFAAGKLGAKLLLMNTGFAKPQFAEVVRREGANILVYDAEFSDILGDVADTVPRYLAWVDEQTPQPTLDTLIASAPTADLLRPKSVGGLVLLTSGTTGTPKGATRNITSPLSVAQFVDRIPVRMKERTFFGAPLFHGTGLSQFLLTLAIGGTTITRRRFDPLATLEMVQRYRCEMLVLVPTMLQRILQLGDDVITSHDTSSLRILFVAGSAVPPEVGNHAMDLFGDVLYNLYGSTEVAVASVATPRDWKQAPGTVGRVPVGCTVRIYDDRGRRVTSPDVPGRIFVGSGLKFSGYTGGGTKDEIDGLLSSGDLGHFDASGLLFVDGRADDMIVSGGENVFPGEVENLLLQHKDIADAAVIGVEDAEFGARLKAFVVLREDASLTADDVRAHVRSELARHKVPRDVQFLPELPRNATGKLIRDELASDE
jgi:fatty-acyl-CoA synthase